MPGGCAAMPVFRIAGFVAKLLTWLCQAILLGLFCLITMQIVLRYGFSFSFSWAEELARYALIWMILLGVGLLVRLDDHLAIPSFQTVLPARLRLAAQAAVHLATAYIGALLLLEGYARAEDMDFMQAVGLGTSMFWPLMAIPAGGALICAFALIRFALKAASLVSGRDLEDPLAEAERQEIAISTESGQR